MKYEQEVILCKCQRAGDEPFTFASIHTPFTFTEEEHMENREKSGDSDLQDDFIAKIFQRMATMGRCRRIVIGDFNRLPDDYGVVNQ